MPTVLISTRQAELLSRSRDLYSTLLNVFTEASPPHLFDPRGGESGRTLAAAIAFVVALLVHLFLLFLAPEQFYLAPLTIAEPKAMELELEIASAETPEEETLRFVEANPDAPENTPDRTDQYSYRSTQAADQSVAKSILEAPKVDGDEPSQKIIDGKLEQPLVPPLVVAAAAPASAMNAAANEESSTEMVAAPLVPRLPVAEFIRQSELPLDDKGSSPDREDRENRSLENLPEEAPIALYQDAVGVVNTVAPSVADAMSPQEVKPVPQARPRLAPELLTGPIMQSQGSASRRGALSIDATFNEFGEYEQQFYAALQLGWYQEIEFYQPIDTASTVAIRFTMQADGSIHDITVLHSNASELATILCESALAKRSPFRSWTQEMIAVFGLERTLTVRFNYR